MSDIMDTFPGSKIITESTIHQFRQALREDEKAEATIEKYTASVRKFMQYLDGSEITKTRLLSFRDTLLNELKAQSVNGFLSAINSYLDFCGFPGYRLKLLKIQRQVYCPAKKEMSRKEYDRLIRTAKKQRKWRLLLIMETICSTGIRVSEIRHITVEAVKNGEAEISLKGKNRTILLPRKLCKKLKKYAKRNGITSGEIFKTRNGTALSRKQIWAEMKSICQDAGVDDSKVFPHNLRHLFARCFYQSSNDIVKLADVLGHSSVETTRIYLKTTEEEHVKILESLRLVS